MIEIRYCFEFDDHNNEEFLLKLNDKTLEVINGTSGDFPEWIKLENHQCPHCPLVSSDHPNCPVALSLSSVINKFDKVVSYDELDLKVITGARQVKQRTTAQKAISSLLGLLFATSGCPYTNYLKPMARFHLPLASEEDTIFRAAGMYLLAQYFLKKKGGKSDLELDGLKKIYDDLHQLNMSIADRVRSTTQNDSSVNAVILLDMFTNLMPFVIDEQLNEIQCFFDSYH